MPPLPPLPQTQPPLPQHPMPQPPLPPQLKVAQTAAYCPVPQPWAWQPPPPMQIHPTQYRGMRWRGPRMHQNHHRGGYMPRSRGSSRGMSQRYNPYDYNNWQGSVPAFNPHEPPPPLPSILKLEPDNDENPDEPVIKTSKAKKRSMSVSYPTKPWNREDADRALREEVLHMKGVRNQSLIIRFPDPKLTKDLVKNFHPGIENVHFQVPSGARYCFVQLSENVNPDKTLKELKQIKFGSGHLVVEKKFSKEEEDLSPEAIDPYTLYIGNLPTNVNVAWVKDKFPTAARVDIGFAQKMKFTRYAFIRYNNVEEAINAYRKTNNLVLDSRSIIVRFRRRRGPVGLPGETKQANLSEGEEVELKKDEDIKKEEEENEEEDDDDDDEDEDDDDDDDDDDDPDAEEFDEDDDDTDEEENPDDSDDDPDEENEKEMEEDDDEQEEVADQKKPSKMEINNVEEEENKSADDDDDDDDDDEEEEVEEDDEEEEDEEEDEKEEAEGEGDDDSEDENDNDDDDDDEDEDESEKKNSTNKTFDKIFSQIGDFEKKKKK